MSIGTTDLKEVEDVILTKLTQNGVQWAPQDLIKQLTTGASPDEVLPEDLVRIAIWYLIDRGAVNLTLDWKLELPERSTATE